MTMFESLGPLQVSVLEGILGFGIFFLGLGLGLLLRGGARGPQRLRIVEEELAAEREKGEAFRAGVTKHFAGTSDLFRDLTRQHAALYAHLAEGARDLSDEIPEIGSGYSDPTLQIGAEGPRVEDPPEPEETPLQDEVEQDGVEVPRAENPPERETAPSQDEVEPPVT